MIRTRLVLFQMALLMLMAVSANANIAATSSAAMNRKARVLQRGSKHKEKVRGQFGRSAKNHESTDADATAARRELQSSGKGKGKGGGAVTSAPGVADNPSQDEHTNIFDHSGPTMQVECGSPTSPFLTTFVTSVKFREGGKLPTSAPGSKQGSKKDSKEKSLKSTTASGKGKGKGASERMNTTASGKGKGKGASEMMSATPSGKGKGKGGSGQGSKYASGDGYFQEGGGSGTDIPPNVLTREEQMHLEGLFEEVYNQLSFLNCDGFFRTVFTASMTLASRDNVDKDGVYTVTLDQSFQDDGIDTSSAPTYSPDATIAFGTPGTRHRQLQEPGSSPSPTTVSPNTAVPTTVSPTSANPSTATPTTATPITERPTTASPTSPSPTIANNTKGRQSIWGESLYSSTSAPQPTTTTATGTQTVVGGPLLTIYYVSLTATCRNCKVTPEVNFPLLMIPRDELGDAIPGILTLVNSSAPEEDVCTCPAGIDDEASSRRELQASLYVPRPRGPTSEELIAAMNHAIARNEVLKHRVEGLVQLIEPDYFDGRNPPLVDYNTTAPTFYTTGTNAPTYIAVATRYPTTAPSGSREIELSAAFRGATSFALALAVMSLSLFLL
jgi:hypothetical protein